MTRSLGFAGQVSGRKGSAWRMTRKRQEHADGERIYLTTKHGLGWRISKSPPGAGERSVPSRSENGIAYDVFPRSTGRGEGNPAERR